MCRVAQQGEDRALRKPLLRQLHLRFRVKTSSVKTMVQSAAFAQVQRWLDRMVFAATLDEVFREGLQQAMPP